MTSHTIQLVAVPERCYRCHRLTCGIVGVLTPGAHGETFREFDDVAHALAETLSPEALRIASIGPIKERRSRNRGAHLSNGCVHCDALLGSAPLREVYDEAMREGLDCDRLVVRIQVG